MSFSCVFRFSMTSRQCCKTVRGTAETHWKKGGGGEDKKQQEEISEEVHIQSMGPLLRRSSEF